VTASARSGQDRSLFSRSIDGSPISLPDDDISKLDTPEDMQLIETSTASYESFISMLFLKCRFQPYFAYRGFYVAKFKNKNVSKTANNFKK
jgi:hypothetical protein